MGYENQQYVMELVLFKLKEGTDKDRFYQAASDLSEALQTDIPGFIGRTLLHTEDEAEWSDIIHWSNMETAMNAMEQLKSVPAFHTFVSMIDTEEIIMKHLVPTHLNN